MMGRYSNLVLTGENGIITDCLKHISMDVSQKHAVLPGLTYSYPPAPENKVSPDDEDGVLSLLSKFEGGKLADFIMGGVYGYSPLTMREIVFRTFNTLTPEVSDVQNNAYKFLEELKYLCKNNWINMDSLDLKNWYVVKDTKQIIISDWTNLITCNNTNKQSNFINQINKICGLVYP